MKAKFKFTWAASTVAVVGLLLLVTVIQTSRAATEPAKTVASSDSVPASPSQLSSNSQPVKVIPPSSVNLPRPLAEVVRMSEAGISDSVITNYISKSTVSYRITADQIVYLQDIGISSDVIQALVKQSGEENTQVAEASNANAPSEAATTANTVTETNTVATAPAPANVFYDSLSPYGAWLDLPPYGWCWQPTAVFLDSDWQPYCNNGYWLWSDYGWYWNSYYSWGWAPFHYGRWFCHPTRGWLWRPGNVWGPAWVCWRNTPGYCGWAPLPPGARFTAGVGWTFHGARVGFDFGFGLAASRFTFVSDRHFCDRRPFSHFASRREADALFHRGRVSNNYTFADHRIINRGVDRSRIEAATHSRLHEVAIRELPHRTDQFTRPDRLERSHDSLVIYRPGSHISVQRNPALHDLSGRHETARTASVVSNRRLTERYYETPRGAELMMRPNEGSDRFGTRSRDSTAAAFHRNENRITTPSIRSRSGENSHHFSASPSRSSQSIWSGSSAHREAQSHYSAPVIRYSSPSPSRSAPTHLWNRPSRNASTRSFHIVPSAPRPQYHSSFNFRRTPSYSFSRTHSVPQFHSFRSSPAPSISRPSSSFRGISRSYAPSRSSGSRGFGHGHFGRR